MNTNKKSKFSQFKKDYRFSYRDSSRTAHTVLWLAFLFIIVGLLWSYYASIEEVTIGQGKVIPSKQLQVIQNLEGGIIKEILVKPGQMVNKGQILAYLDNTRFESDYSATKQKESALEIKVLRLNAEINQKPFVIPAALKKDHPELSSSEVSLYESRKHQLAVLNERKQSIAKEIAMTTPLIKEGAVSRVEVLRLERDLGEVESQISQFQSTALDELNKAKTELSTLQQEIRAADDRLNRTTVRSPVKGVINEVYLNTVGGVIKPGENLMDIVPLDDTLLVEARIRPSDVGFIKVGQDATVKITAYDFTIYGGLKGHVEHISADTIKDEKKDENYYEIWVRTKQNYIQTPEKRLYIIPGMTASVDILTGHKTVLEYILKPIIKAKQSALRER